MSDRPDPRWEAFARREPYFAVLTSPRYRRDRLTAEREREFFDSGETLIDHLFHLIEERIAPNFAPTAILEYGCGAGRLTLPLARRAARRGGTVAAVDVSPAMLAHARSQADRSSLGNIEFSAPEAFRASSRTFDFLVCYLLLQRLRPRDGLRLVRQLMSRLAPGGIAVFQLPYVSTASPGVRASRWIRERSRLVNGCVNLARGEPFGDPFIPSHAYDLSRVLNVVQEEAEGTVNALFEPHQGLQAALLVVERPLVRGAGAVGRPPVRSERVDVATLIEQTPIDELNRAAERYFEALDDREHHLTKPFSQPHEAPALLAGMAAVLHGLQLVPGADVLEFGAGTGWLSRDITQLGCRSILLDVSRTALDIARELYERLPIIGDRPAPLYLLFDGTRIDLPDESVDRIVCFHAFHHAPNPASILLEFARILRPGGIAGFMEPGPRHSRAPFSQFEMQTYKVVENDVDVHEVWRVARTAGFSDLKLSIFNALPLFLSLEAFEDFLAGGATTEQWASSSRVFMRNARAFFLTKRGDARIDSRRADALSCTIGAALVDGPPRPDRAIAVDVTVTNTGRAVWLPAGITPGGVSVGAHLYGEGGELLAFDLCTAPLTTPPREVSPQETVVCRLSLPPRPAGRYVVELDCVAARISWFAPLGSRACRIPLNIVGPSL